MKFFELIREIARLHGKLLIDFWWVWLILLAVLVGIYGLLSYFSSK